MNILWIYDHPFNPEAGGTERSTSTIMKGLSQQGHNCMAFLVFDQDNRGHINYNEIIVANLYEFLKFNKIDIVINQIAYASWLLEDFFTYGGDKWKKEGGKIISCLHFDPIFPSISIPNLLIGWKKKSLFGKSKRLIRIALTPWYNRCEKKLHRYSYKFIYDHSDAYVLLSQMHQPSFVKFSGIKYHKKLFAIFNPLTFQDISTLDIIHKKEKIILVVSRLHEPQKRISYILKAWKRLADLKECESWQLVIVGKGESEEFYKDLALKWKLPRVSFEGQQPPEPYYKKASISLMTSSAEGWGMTLTESLQRAVVPIVMESSKVFREILNDGITGFLVPNDDLEQFIEKIALLISDYDLRTSMARNALKDAERFTLARALNQWENLFKSIN